MTMDKTERELVPQGAATLERSRRAPLWADVPDEQWDDWRWQLSHRLNTVDELGAVLSSLTRSAAGSARRASSASTSPRISPR
jgi:L-lysine 2,3-aminomutase